jgi:uncharacterized protein (DUF486 family)
LYYNRAATMQLDERWKVFAALWLGEGVQPRYLVSFGLILAAVVVAFR